MTSIPNYQQIVIFRCTTGNPSISKPLDGSLQLIINYNCDRDWFIVWNAAIQSHIHHGKKLQPDIGKEGEEKLHQQIAPASIMTFFRETGRGGSEYVEMISIVGKDALSDFCKDYKEKIKPDPKDIPEGKICLYAVAGGDLEYIPHRED